MFQTLSEKRITAEHALLVIFLVLGIFIFIGSTDLSDRAAAFPRFTSGITIACVTLLLIRSYLPTPLRKLVMDTDNALTDMRDDVPVGLAQDDQTESGDDQLSPILARSEYPTVDTSDRRYVDLRWVWMDGALYTGILTALFIIVSYTSGMLWAAPMFVAAFLLGMRRPWYLILGLSVLAFGAAFAFYWVLGIDIASGTIFDIEWTLEVILDLVGLG